MKNRQTLLLTGIFMLLAFTFIQCDPVSGPGNNTTNPDPTEPPAGEVQKPELIAPENGAENQSTSIELKWKTQNGINEYILQISDSEDFSSPVVSATVEGSSYTIEESLLSHETVYFWKVIPGTGKDPESDVWTFTTGTENAEPVVAVLAAPEDNATLPNEEIRFEWESVSEASRYHLHIAGDAGFSEIKIDTLVTEPFFQPEVLDGGELYWRVSPILTQGTGAWSDMRTLTVLSGNGDDDSDPTLPVVSLVSPSSGSVESLPVTLEWDAVDGFDEYQIQIATSDQFQNPETEETVTGTSYDADGLDKDQTWYWRVRVADDLGHGEWSETRSFETEADVTTPQNPNAFVRAENGDFIVDGEVFRFAGTNAYYLPNYEKLDSRVVDRAFDAFEEAGITVVRMWAFYDGYDCGYSRTDRNENVIQTAPGVYDERALRDLDRVIAKGKEHGIRFVLPFINYWDELGGVCQYNTWAGASNPGRNTSFFIDNPDTQKWFRDYISMLLNRVNTVTGVAYKDEPAIFAWQIMNEGRLPGANPARLRDWYQEIAQYIKSIDSNHLLGTGEEGFDEGTPPDYSVSEYSNTYALRAQTGSSYVMNMAIPEIDFGTAHWYGPDYGFGQAVGESMLRAQRAWVSDHARIAEEHGKPFFIGEYGYPGWGDNRVVTAYEDFWSYAEQIDLDGSLLWQLTADHVKCYEFGGNICWPAGRADSNLFRGFQDHIQTMSNSR